MSFLQIENRIRRDSDTAPPFLCCAPLAPALCMYLYLSSSRFPLFPSPRVTFEPLESTEDKRDLRILISFLVSSFPPYASTIASAASGGALASSARLRCGGRSGAHVAQVRASSLLRIRLRPPRAEAQREGQRVAPDVADQGAQQAAGGGEGEAEGGEAEAGGKGTPHRRSQPAARDATSGRAWRVGLPKIIRWHPTPPYPTSPHPNPTLTPP